MAAQASAISDRVVDTFFTPLPVEAVAGISLPTLFTCPFYYEPHPLSLLATADLQQYLSTQTDWVHNFGLGSPREGNGLVIGKMFGVLVVKDTNGHLGYLAAFSGKLAGGNHHHRFVPPVFDMLREDGFFRQEETQLTALNQQIESLQNSETLAIARQQLSEATQAYEQRLAALKADISSQKLKRQQAREEASRLLSEQDYQQLDTQLRQESTQEQYNLKNFKRLQTALLAEKQAKVAALLTTIQSLLQERKERSAALQERLFEQYTFLNALGEQRSLRAIFQQAPKPEPPAGAGECAAPKLLQYAFLKGYTPLAIAEFWWGQSPSSEIRTHRHFYPACRSKCVPILGHMLAGLACEPNPLLSNPAENKALPIVYEDTDLLVVNKPHDFLSVPGRSVKDSVYTRIRARNPEASGPLIVHRLDMSTSGLMVVPKNLPAYIQLQRQFLKRSIRKRYLAILEGEVQGEEGEINLPLRVDLNDRPRQLVCYEHGKKATTRWQVIARQAGYTTVHFYPITGRSHQLRVHAAHPQGLHCPIKGDDIYGRRSDRLYLHAAYLAFEHPTTKEILQFEVPFPTTLPHE